MRATMPQRQLLNNASRAAPHASRLLARTRTHNHSILCAVAQGHKSDVGITNVLAFVWGCGPPGPENVCFAASPKDPSQQLAQPKKDSGIKTLISGRRREGTRGVRGETHSYGINSLPLPEPGAIFGHRVTTTTIWTPHLKIRSRQSNHLLG